VTPGKPSAVPSKLVSTRWPPPAAPDCWCRFRYRQEKNRGNRRPYAALPTLMSASLRQASDSAPDVFPQPGPDPSPEPEPTPLPSPDPDPEFPVGPLPTPVPVY
jgi:hypothetical protein